MIRRNLLLALFFLLNLSTFSFSRKLFPEKTPQQDKTILLKLKKSFTDPNNVLSSWAPHSKNRCSWHGVSCNSDSRVVSLILTSCDDDKDDSVSCLNRLKGQKISTLIASLTKLEILSLPFNDLKGHIPIKIQNLQRLELLVLKGNTFTIRRKLKSVNEEEEGEPTPNSDQDSHDKTGLYPIEIASIVSASVIVFVLLVLLVLFVYTRKWKQNSKVRVAETKEIKVFVDVGVPLTYEVVVSATGYFSNSNCIGHGGFGSTYKAEVSQNNVFAVKRLSVGRFQGDQQFHAEISALETVKHPNLVVLIGYHASETEMFLIYNYLSGGNLEDFIKERSKPALEWKIVHKIALDVARALAYLHEQCSPKVLHRDIKPSNILLDDNYNAYLSDFGLAKLLGTSQSHVTTGVAGTFGYVAPEYAMTCRVSEKADVYSYGIVLLELISDKRALDPSFSSHENGFNIVSWAHMMLSQGKAKDVFTKGLWESGPQDDLVEVLHLALKCTVDSLSIRPTMKQALKLLKRIQPSRY
ncbi:unnamed protein product [Cochlearia groenlandica]